MNLLVTGALSVSQNELNTLKDLGHNVIFMQQEKDPLPCEYTWVEGIVGNGIFLWHPIENFTSLRYIQLTSAGFDRVPMEYITSHNIAINNARGVYSVPMAEFAVGGVLQLYKQSNFFGKNQQNHEWQKHRGLLELFGKTVCVVGCGSVGNECAKRFSAFGCTVTGVDITPYTNELYKTMYPIESLKASLSDADIVVLTLPLTDKTKNLFDKDVFASMREGAVLVNIARGAIVDTEALISTLNSGRLFGTVLDVFETEPLSSDSELWDIPNVIITPHNSFVSDGNAKRMFDLVIKNLEGIQ